MIWGVFILCFLVRIELFVCLVDALLLWFCWCVILVIVLCGLDS